MATGVILLRPMTADDVDAVVGLAVGQLTDRARELGGMTVVADTTPDDAAALAVLRRRGATMHAAEDDRGTVAARIEVR